MSKNSTQTVSLSPNGGETVLEKKEKVPEMESSMNQPELPLMVSEISMSLNISICEYKNFQKG